MGICNHWTTVHLLFAQQTNLPFSEFQFIKVVLQLSKGQKNQRNHIRYSPQLSARVSKLRGLVYFPETALFLPSLSTLREDKSPDKTLLCSEDPHPAYELRNAVLGSVHSKYGPGKMQAWLLELKHFSCLEKALSSHKWHWKAEQATQIYISLAILWHNLKIGKGERQAGRERDTNWWIFQRKLSEISSNWHCAL